MFPLRVAILWHFHQPDYRSQGTAKLPWVRMHATKDYLDVAQIIGSYPSVRHTINVVPSLAAQIADTLMGVQDPVLALLRLPSDTLTPGQRQELFDWVRTAQYSTMVRPWPRFDALWAKLKSNESDITNQEIADLQMWVLLMWTGPVARELQPVRAMLLKGALFTRSEIDDVIRFHDERIAQIEPTLSLLGKQSVELSSTPYHHPILPLLIDTDCALESTPTAVVPKPPLRRPADAEEHVRLAIADHIKRFGAPPLGMWPAEGSVSTEVLAMFARHGIQWTATDEAVLRNTLGTDWQETSAWFPWQFNTTDGTISVLFRDNELSDAIGFSYASWEPVAAAKDFLRRLEQRRNILISHHGEQILEHAVVPIILDGENCWEFYQENGRPFLETLLRTLSESAEYNCITFSEASEHSHCVGGTALTSIHPGSWIHGTFDVWIGSPSKNAAWSALRDVANAVDATEEPRRGALLGSLLVAEASDTFWWYHEHHHAPHRELFDELFRERLRSINAQADSPVHIDLHTSFYNLDMMNESRRIPISFSGSAMHTADELTLDCSLETQESWQRIVVRFQRWPNEGQSVALSLLDRHSQERSCLVSSNGETLWSSPLHDEGCARREDLAIAMYVHAASGWTLRITEDVGPIRVAEVHLE